MNKKIVTSVALLVVAIAVIVGFVVITENKKNAKLVFVQKMGNGLNVGNSLDATNLHQYIPGASELDYETFWKNPKITPELFTTIHQAGFDTVRIPVTLEDHLDENNRISEVWMNRVDEVIQEALSEGLYVIVDLHADSWLDLKLDNKEFIMDKFVTVWNQIANRFEECDDHLLFEGMNEPRLRNTEYEWTDGTSELRTFVNELNQLFVDTIRKTGGNNTNRYLLVTMYCNNPLKDGINDLIVPEGNIIVSAHLYKPYNFAQNRDGTNQWSEDKPEDVKEIDEAFMMLNAAFIEKKIPVIITEYGCVDKDNLDTRLAWAAYYLEKSKQYHIPLVWWDNGQEYRLIDRINNTWVFPELVEIVK